MNKNICIVSANEGSKESLENRLSKLCESTMAICPIQTAIKINIINGAIF